MLVFKRGFSDMSEEEFAILLAEFKLLQRGLSDAVKQIVHHEGEIEALQELLEAKGLFSSIEIRSATEESARKVDAFVHGPERDGTEVQSRNELGISRVHQWSRSRRNCRRRF